METVTYQGIPIRKNIFWIGINDHDTEHFEAIWPMPHGITYNSYLIMDDKVALMDTVKSIFSQTYLKKVTGILGGKKINYLIINHMEPDHSGSITALLETFPDLQIVGNQKTMEFLAQYYGITKHLKLVQDGEILNLGRRKVKFLLTPMVHWPETMMTYVEEDKILFSGDVFGGFGTLEEGLFDDEVTNIYFYEEEILRYFTNVISRYSVMVQKAMEKIKDLPIKIIASTHGLIWRKDPARILHLYDQWSKQETEESVVIAYASMYGNTQKMMEALARSLINEGIKKVKVHNVSQTHASYIVTDAWRFKAILLGSPTYNTKLFPLMDDLIHLMENKMMKPRFVGFFGSYGWSGGGMKEFSDFAKRIKWEVIEPLIEVKGAPTTNDLQNCALLGKNIAHRLNRK